MSSLRVDTRRPSQMNPAATAALVGLLLSAGTTAVRTETWPQWRGPSLNGTSPDTGLPTRWDRRNGIQWSLAMPGTSASTPIVWNGHVFLSVAEGDTLSLWALDRVTGTVRWKRPLGGGNQTPRKHNMSSPSPVTDGTRVWVMTGTGRLTAFDFAGTALWTRDLQQEYGRFGQQWGYASSPLLHDGALYVQVVHGMFTDDPSYVLRIDGRTGRTVWKTNRPSSALRESPDAYTTPALWRHGGTVEVVVTGADVVTGYDPATGHEVWRAGGLNPNNHFAQRIVASPIAAGDLLYAPSRDRPLLAIRAGGRGDISRSHVAWTSNDGPDVPTPVTDGTHLYVVRDNGVLWCLDARTGARVYGPQRLRSGTYSASPVLADGKLYATSEDGVTSVVRTGPTFELLAENDLDDYVLASPAISDGQLFLRTTGHLWAIGARRTAPAK